jgi:coenzyme F420 biosynthesis associated uncharacterized protein
MADKIDDQDPNNIGKIMLGLGVASAAAFGAAWVNSRAKQAQRQGPPSMIDWVQVRKLAHRMSQEQPTSADWHLKWNDYYQKLVLRVVPIIEDYVQTKLPRELSSVNVVSRTGWIDANITSFKNLFEPIENMNREAIKKAGAVSQAMMGSFNQMVLSGEVGILLGYLSQRVLGQYDLSLLGNKSENDGKVYFVEPNINKVVSNLGLSGDEFRLWIALHESTHAFEFESYPWVREYFNSLLEKYFSYIKTDLESMSANGQGLSGFINRVRNNGQQGGAWLERIMTPQQRELFNQLQALMSIVEGYSNHVMNAVGEKLMPNYNQIKERIEQRQKNRSLIDRVFVKLTGLNLKMEQYRLGEIFVDAVVEKKGIVFGNLMWKKPEYVPTLDEIKNPDKWVARIEKLESAEVA